MASTRKRANLTPIERFPTKARRDGRFQKRIRGVIHYFGQDGDRKAALAEYERVKAALYAGTNPGPTAGEASATTVKELANRFLDDKLADANAGMIEEATYHKYKAALRHFIRFTRPDRLIDDLRPDDFREYARRLRQRLGPHAFNRERATVTAMFNHAVKNDWMDRPVKFGNGFKKATRVELRTKKKKLWSSDEIARIVGAAGPQLKAMILLGLNGAFGSKDCAQLPRTSVDFKKKMIDFPRGKTGEERIVPLWDRTIDALKVVMKARQDDSLVFRTKSGMPWVRSVGSVNHDAACGRFNKILCDLDANAVAEAKERGDEVDAIPKLKVQGVGFYSLRHTFATYADAGRDSNAKKRIMGHRLEGMDDVYVETLELGRLRELTNLVERKCFPD